MADRYIVALDQGTTSSRAVLFNSKSEIVGISQKELMQHYPKPGWVEHDPMEIWESQREMFEQVIEKHSIDPSDVKAIGISNQRETTVVWDRKTGEPVCNAIVWQDRRTAPICELLKNDGMEGYVRENTGLVIDAYFSGTKVRWILENIEDARNRADDYELLFGTIDTWLIWKMTNGRVHATDYSNASRTLLYNIHKREWDSELLKAMDIPESMLPDVRDSSGDFGVFEYRGAKIPIRGVAGDQQAALFGQTCFEPGMAKNTYGTGCFVLMNTGEKPSSSQSGLITTIAWGIDGKIEYALEGSVFIAGAAVQWLRDGLKIIDSASDSEGLALQASSGDVYVVPAFVGLGAPYWDMYARGAIFGLTRDTGREHIARATLESMAYQTKDVLGVMEKDSNITVRKLQVDGGASTNDFLMQFQADILGTVVERPHVIESTALGAAYLAGISAGLWEKEQIVARRRIYKSFSPEIDGETRESLYNGWQKAVRRTMNWVEHND